MSKQIIKAGLLYKLSGILTPKLFLSGSINYIFSGPCALIQFIEDGSDNEDDDQEDPEDICEKNCDDAMQPVCVNFQFSLNF